MVDLSYLDEYQQLNPYHPRFTRNYAAIMELLEHFLVSGKITQTQYREYKRNFEARSGNKGTKIFSLAHNWLLRLEREADFIGESAANFHVVVSVSQLCQDFRNWVSSYQQTFNDPKVVEIVKKLSLKLLDLWDSKDDNFWAYYRYLELILTWSVNNGQLLRKNATPFINIYLHFLVKEMEIAREADKEVQGLNAYAGDVISSMVFDDKYQRVFDYYEEKVSLMRAYFEGYGVFLEEHEKKVKILEGLLYKKEVTPAEYDLNAAELKTIVSTVYSARNFIPHQPIQLHHWGVSALDFYHTAVIFNPSQLMAAAEYCDRFLRATNPRLLYRNMVQYVIDDTVSYNSSDPEFLEKRYDLVMNHLKMLLDSKLLSSDEYIRGRTEANAQIYGRR